MDEYFDNYCILDKFSVSRETFLELDKFRELIIEKNQKTNLISRKSINNFKCYIFKFLF